MFVGDLVVPDRSPLAWWFRRNRHFRNHHLTASQRACARACRARDTVETVATILTSLADLPRAETPDQERARRIKEKLDRRLTTAQRREQSERDKARWRREREQVSAVIWLDPPVPIKQGSRLMVVGVCASAPRDLKRQYGITV